MNKCFLYFIFFLLLSFQTFGADQVEQIGVGSLQGTHHLQSSEMVDDNEDFASHMNRNEGGAQNTVAPGPAQELDDQQRDETAFLLSEDETLPYNPRDENETALFDSINYNIFNLYDSWWAKALRWSGRGLGVMAENAMVPMILFVILGLINTQTNDAFDYTIIALMLSYLLLPATENMAQMFQNIYDYCGCCRDPISAIPPLYKGINPFPSTLLTGASALHAGAMTLILTGIFYDIEDSSRAHFNWFFWTFVFPYGLGVFNRYNSFFRYGQAIEQAHHLIESDGQKRTRQILEDALRKFDTVSLRKLKSKDLRALYLFLRDPDNTVTAKLQKISLITNSDIIGSLAREAINDDFMSATERVHYTRPWTIRAEIADEVFKLFFYASSIGEYVLYQYGIGLALKNFGATSPQTISIISNLSASVLSIISFYFESRSVKRLYLETAERKFGSSYSTSNPYWRTGVGVMAFLTSGIIALSETYPSWSRTIAGDSVAWPLLVFMALRHHARNKFWLQSGFDRVITHWHLRDCWRAACCWKKCRPGNNPEEMIDLISVQFVHRLLSYNDQLNADGIATVYKAYFGHDPKHD